MAQGLLDFLQGASNSAASNISAPIDGINWLLKKAGLPVSEKPFLGSDWMGDKGLTAAPQNRNMGLLGESIGSVLPMVAAAKAPQIANGLLTMADNAMAPRTLNPQTGAIVWHGSPHKFNAFDASKIGTGEGAQAYGHGLYLAESPDVAKTYMDFNGTLPIKYLADGDLINPKSIGHSVADDIFHHGKGMAKMYATQNGQEFLDAFNKLQSKKIAASRSAGSSLYKVDLPDEHIAKMLDWDKPLSQQAPEVQVALSKVARTDATGEQAWKAAVRESGNPFSPIVGQHGALFATPDAAAKNLQRLGIPGIRYLDGGSRGAGQGTSNYVVFPGNEGLLKILERNGQHIK